MQYGHWAGIAAIGALKRCDAILSGFLGSPAQARAAVDIVRVVKSMNPNAWYFCDPAMCQTGGVRPEPGVEEFIVNELPELANGMAPTTASCRSSPGAASKRSPRRSRRAARSSSSSTCTTAIVPPTVSTCSP